MVVSNVPPFFKNDMLLRQLSRHQRIVFPLGTKSPLLRQVVSFRQHVTMIFNIIEELRLTLRFRVDKFDYKNVLVVGRRTI